LILELRLLQEVLDFLRIVVVALPTDPLNFADLASPSGSLDVLEMNLGIFAKVDDGPEIVVKT
jgi:hypothetical protein